MPQRGKRISISKSDKNQNLTTTEPKKKKIMAHGQECAAASGNNGGQNFADTPQSSQVT